MPPKGGSRAKRKLSDPDLSVETPRQRPAFGKQMSSNSLDTPRGLVPKLDGSTSTHVDHRAQIDNDDWYGKLSHCDFKDAQDVVEHLQERHRGGSGKARCPFGSSPQLLATLYAESEFTWKDTIAKGCPTWTETNRHCQLAKDLWTNKEYLGELGYKRTDKYNEKEKKHYLGENALHLAIVKRRGDLVHHFISKAAKAERKPLLECHAVGKFPIDFLRIDMGDGTWHRGCVYGETPLCWAACTCQKELFQYLMLCGANVACTVNRTGDTILHMLVRLTRMTSNNHDADETAETDTECFTDMYDFVLECAAHATATYDRPKLGNKPEKELDGTRVVMLGAETNRRYGTLMSSGDSLSVNVDGSFVRAVRRTEDKEFGLEANELVVEMGGQFYRIAPDLQYTLNKQGLTPLMLAAKEGSKGMFEHMMNRKLQPMWIFGPKIGVSLCLRDIDQDFSGGKTKMYNTADLACNSKTSEQRRSPSSHVFSMLVRSERGDLLDTDVMRAFLESKWRRYACHIAHRIFAQTCVLLFCFFDLKAIKPMSGPALLAQIDVSKEFAFLHLSLLIFALVGVNCSFHLIDCGLNLSNSPVAQLTRVYKRLFNVSLQSAWVVLSCAIPVARLVAHAESWAQCCSWSFLAAVEFSVWASLLWLNYLPSLAWGDHKWWRQVWTRFSHQRAEDDGEEGDEADDDCDDDCNKPEAPNAGEVELWDEHDQATLDGVAGLPAGGWFFQHVLHLGAPLHLLDVGVHLAALCCLVHACGALDLALDLCRSAALAVGVEWCARGEGGPGGVLASYAVTSGRMKSASTALLLMGSFRFFALEMREVVHVGLREYANNHEVLLDVIQSVSGFLLFPLGTLLLTGLPEPFVQLDLLVSLGFCLCCFFRLLFYLLGFERYGHLLHLIWGMRRDVITVVVIYFAVTIGFSVTFAITDADSPLGVDGGSGTGPVTSSLLLSLKHYFWNSLNAFAGGGLDEEESWQMSDPRIKDGTHLITGLTINLLRFVSQLVAPLILVNLLIAMMGRKYEVFRESEDQQWQLARARIILSIDDEFAQTLFDTDKRKYADFLSTRQMDLSMALKGIPDQRRRYLLMPTRGAHELRDAARRLEKKAIDRRPSAKSLQ